MPVDDCSNNWGANLVCNGPTSLEHYTPCKRTSASNKRLLTSFNACINKSCHPFKLQHISASGSEANLWCYLHCSYEFGLNAVVFACGGYVSADGSHLQSFSTTEWQGNGKFSVIASPNSTTTTISTRKKSQIVALPYYIPSPLLDTDSHAFIEYECLCLKELHARFLIAKINGIPISLISMELILAGSGAILTTRFLENLGKLCMHHNVSVHVDEILTAGRTGAMLFTMQQPQSFIDATIAITIGKWSHFGMVMIKDDWTMQHGVQYGNLRQRGFTVEHLLVTDELLKHFEYVQQNLGKAKEQRIALLEALGVQEHDSWGVGVIVFCSKIRGDACLGFQCRYLPTLDSGGKYKFKIAKPSYTSKTQASYISRITCDKVLEWLDYSRTISLYPGISLDRMILNVFSCVTQQQFSFGFTVHNMHSRLEEVDEEHAEAEDGVRVSGQKRKFGDISQSFRRMKDGEIGFFQLKGVRRIRHFVPHKTVHYNFDEIEYGGPRSDSESEESIPNNDSDGSLSSNSDSEESVPNNDSSDAENSESDNDSSNAEDSESEDDTLVPEDNDMDDGNEDDHSAVEQDKQVQEDSQKNENKEESQKKEEDEGYFFDYTDESSESDTENQPIPDSNYNTADED